MKTRAAVGADTNTLKGEDGNDILEIKCGIDIGMLDGGDGHDILTGGEGDDALDGSCPRWTPAPERLPVREADGSQSAHL